MGKNTYPGSETCRRQDLHEHVQRNLQQPRHHSRHEPAQRSTKAAPLVLHQRLRLSVHLGRPSPHRLAPDAERAGLGASDGYTGGGQRGHGLRLETGTVGLLASGSVRGSRGGEDPSSVVGCATPVAGHEGGGVAEAQVCAPGQGILRLEWRAEGVGVMSGGETCSSAVGCGVVDLVEPHATQL